MNRKQVNILLIVLVVLNVLDGDLSHPSTLDFIKFALLAFCIYFNNRKDR